jgi:ferredoxin
MPKVCIRYRDQEMSFEVAEGQSILDIARANALPIEGLCGGEMDCSTCHVIVDPSWYEKLPAAAEAEEDMLDLIPGCASTSRLGCQIRLCAALDGLAVRIPEDSRSQS